MHAAWRMQLPLACRPISNVYCCHQGLVPRAKELLKLGLTFFLAFAPLILGIGGLAAALYLTFGQSFVHGGSSSMSPPPYVDPYELLGQPTIDPMVPLGSQKNVPDGESDQPPLDDGPTSL